MDGRGADAAGCGVPERAALACAACALAVSSRKMRSHLPCGEGGAGRTRGPRAEEALALSRVGLALLLHLQLLLEHLLRLALGCLRLLPRGDHAVELRAEHTCAGGAGVYAWWRRHWCCWCWCCCWRGRGRALAEPRVGLGLDALCRLDALSEDDGDEGAEGEGELAVTPVQQRLAQLEARLRGERERGVGRRWRGPLHGGGGRRSAGTAACCTRLRSLGMPTLACPPWYGVAISSLSSFSARSFSIST